MRPKALCKFKGQCKNYISGVPCNFSHDQCKFGSTCKDIQNCKFFHDLQTSSLPKPQSRFEKPIGETECKFGEKCQKRLQGKCFFKHSPSNAQSQIPRADSKKNDFKMGLNKSEMPCKFGDRCTFFPLGKCPYRHEAPQAPQAPQVPQVSQAFSASQNFSAPQAVSGPQYFQAPQREEKHLGALDSLCLRFLTNTQCDENCPKAHEYSETKTISKIFSISDCNRQIKKIMVLQPYSPDEQPLYIILGENRVMFVQLTNLAKEGGNQNISNNTLVMKRWFDRDLAFQGDLIHNSWLVKAESNTNDRSDILVLKCNSGVRFVVFNKERMAGFAFNEEIKDVIFISNILVILTANRKIYGFQYDFTTSGFKELGIILNESLIFLKKYHKKVQGEEFAAGATEQGSICFINSKLKTHMLDMKENIRDVCLAEYLNIPVALALVEKGRIIGINLVTFETTVLLEGNLPKELRCSSLTLTLEHLIMGIDGFGVIVYNYQQFNKIVGILGFGNYRWSVDCNQRGNVTLLSQDSTGRMQANIFRFRRL